ncbi:MAG: DEAD/DEAH box helicase [Candidatus Freyarchaeota archaeon]|nr:DEAD/DEAH box helicase [Candidatus Jordarchaeia archaeon]MBS7270077.1 DEAD/DEAH box helicase [Candidatus Jordarchaeia archaeon]MBS7280739.1 DEAD/DEAH box helicase [Candidatus Jordarchaeia archaeon]
MWAESSHKAAESLKDKGAQTRRGKNQQHPFTLSSDQLVEAIGELSGSLIAERTSSENLTIFLPSTPRAPLPSPELILGEKPVYEKATNLTPWKINTVALHPNLALDFLLSLPTHPPHGVAFSSSLRFWAEVAKFSLEILLNQSFAPTIQESQRNGATVFKAAWEVKLTEEDLEKMNLLSKAMPPICRACEGNKTSWDIILDFLNQTVDSFVRASLSSSTLLPPSKRSREEASLPEQWLRALSSEDSTLDLPVEKLRVFSKEIRSWLDKSQLVDPNAPFRTCFRLEPPGEDGGKDSGWRISFHLQARDDPSLLVPADKVWRECTKVLTFLKRKFENPQERLLADLGVASRLFPMLEESLKTAHPMELRLSSEHAYTFLRQYAPLLKQSGFGVLLPSWWQKPAARLGVKLTLKKASGPRIGSGILGMDSILSYDWKISLGGETLSLREFEELANLKVPLVRVRGQWVELRPEEVERAIKYFKGRGGGGEMTLGEALRIGLGQEESEVGLPVVEIEGDGWIKDFLDKLSNPVKLSTIKTPTTFRGELRPYQLRGVSWLAFLKQFGLGACLADDMGLGKTIQVIALILYGNNGESDRSKRGPTLIICPMSIVGNWHREFQRFAPLLKVMVHHGLDRLSGRDFEKEARKHDVVITTYSLTHRDEETLSRIEWECIVLDEAQNIKNNVAKQTQAIKRLKAKHKIALTGTPVENRLSELWSIMDFLNKGYLGTVKDFHAKYALPIEKYRDPNRAEALKRLVQPFILRRLKTDKTIIKDLPEKMEMKVFCNLTREQATLYEAVVEDMMEKIEISEGIKRKGLVLSTLLKLKQICNHPAQFLHDGSELPGRSGKLARLEEMLEEALAEGDKSLIFTQFAEMGAMLHDHLQKTLDCETLFLHGGTPKRQREIMIQRFQDEKRGPPIFILSIKAGGLGLNLTAANRVFHFDRWWNPAVESQATDRAFRIGQTRNVQVHKFVCVGTLEERIDQMIEQKKELTNLIVGTGETWLTELSTEQLRELFALNRKMVGE